MSGSRRVFIIAAHEFLALVRTKFFIVGILIVPVTMALLGAFMNYTSKQLDRDDRRFAVVDETGRIYAAIESAAAEHNAVVARGDLDAGPRFLPERIDPGQGTRVDAETRLSDRVRGRELLAFVIIPRTALDTSSSEPVRYYSENTAYRRLSTWLQPVVSEAIDHERLTAAGLDPAEVARLTAHEPLETFNLVERQKDGSVSSARPVDQIQNVAMPVFFLAVMFMAIMSNAQHLIQAIIEEKMSKISEVLLGSVSAFQLLMGKLLGIVSISLALAGVYVIGGLYALLAFGRPDLIDLGLIGWFVIFLVSASMMFGAMYEALSSACSDLKDAQSMLQPAMMMLVAAYVVSAFTIRSPDSPIAAALSFIPPVTPFAMMIRLAMPPGPPLWQVLLSIAMLAGVTVLVVWAAGRIFRVGLLMQGKPPNLPELLRWIRQ